MESLKKDLFKDPALEVKKNHTAGVCASSVAGGGTFCCTGGAACTDKVFDVGF